MNRWNRRQRHDREGSRKTPLTAAQRRRNERREVKRAAREAGHPQMARMQGKR